MAVDPFPYWMKEPSKKVMERLNKIVSMITSTMTVRRVCYMLFPGVHGKKLENAYNNTIKDVVRLRIREMLPWDSIRESRCEFVKPYDYYAFDNLEDFIATESDDGETLADRYERNMSITHLRNILVWFEKDTVEPEFKEVCKKYHVPLVCGRGQATWSIKKKLGDFLNADWIVLYCGDNDEKGREIMDVIERDFRYLGCDAEVQWVMVTEEMEAEYDLPEEARLDDFDLEDLKSILENIILEYIDKDELKKLKDEEKKDRQQLRKCKLVLEKNDDDEEYDYDDDDEDREEDYDDDEDEAE